MGSRMALGGGLIALGIGVAANALLGPMALGELRYHVSEHMENQVIGGDIASLVLVAPAAIVAGVLTLRGHRAGPVLGLAPSLFALYLVFQLAIGAEFDRYPGNSERFFPLHAAIVALAGACAILAWSRIDAAALPPLSDRLRKVAGVAFIGVAVFLIMGLHLPGLLDAWSDEPTATEYLENPTVFWVVKMMDLAIVVPAAVATGAGLLANARWANRAAYAIAGWFTLLGAAVAGMAMVMLANDDPDASIGLAMGFGVFVALFAWLAATLYRPLRDTTGGTHR
jgi:hypothetical protein